MNAIARMVDNIRRHDKEIPIYLVNTIYWGDQETIGTMVKQDGTAFSARRIQEPFGQAYHGSDEGHGEEVPGIMKNVVLIPAGTHAQQRRQLRGGRRPASGSGGL